MSISAAHRCPIEVICTEQCIVADRDVAKVAVQHQKMHKGQGMGRLKMQDACLQMFFSSCQTSSKLVGSALNTGAECILCIRDRRSLKYVAICTSLQQKLLLIYLFFIEALSAAWFQAFLW